MATKKQSDPTVSPDTTSNVQVEPTPEVQDSTYQNYLLPGYDNGRDVVVKARTLNEAITKAEKQGSK